MCTIIFFCEFGINHRLLTGSLDQENLICRPQMILETLSSHVRFCGKNTKNLSSLQGLENICIYRVVSVMYNCCLLFTLLLF